MGPREVSINHCNHPLLYFAFPGQAGAGALGAGVLAALVPGLLRMGLPPLEQLRRLWEAKARLAEGQGLQWIR